jgi:hypothetical protein
MTGEVLGAAGLKGDFMQMSSFGSIQISIIPKVGDPKTMEMVMAAENRKEVIRQDLQQGESVDQFVRRMHSMLRGFMTAPVRGPEAEVLKTAEPPVKSFEEIKAALTSNKPAGPVRA